ncbi:MAG TPA: zinc ribbon domain-containing protein [Dehalococcoidia bacterium]|nr:zinc ribbon domain-containing protein [Dehalococcoidia bacterium]
MPIYDFKCRQCGEVSEILLRDSGQTARCSNCGSEDVEKLFTTSYLITTEPKMSGTTCCGRAERCDTPPCSTGGVCRRG